MHSIFVWNMKTQTESCKKDMLQHKDATDILKENMYILV